MKLLIFLGFFGLSNLAFANEAQFGVILGSTTGLSFKYDLGAGRAFDAALSWSNDSHYGSLFHADYLINQARQFAMGELSPNFLYYGIGLRLMNIRSGSDNGKTRLGIRAPIGIHHQISNPDLEFFGELVPTLDLTPSTDVDIDVGIGVRFRF